MLGKLCEPFPSLKPTSLTATFPRYSNVLLVSLNSRGTRGTPHATPVSNINAETELQWRRYTETTDTEAQIPQKVQISTTTEVTRDVSRSSVLWQFGIVEI